MTQSAPPSPIRAEGTQKETQMKTNPPFNACTSAPLVIFHKKRATAWHRPSRVSVPVTAISTIAESHRDGATLIRTKDGGTIVVEEDFLTADSIWNAALAGVSSLPTLPSASATA